MTSFVCDGAEGRFDMALASFAVHHLKSPEEKGRFLTGVRRHLKPGGTLYIVDVFRRDGVSALPTNPCAVVSAPTPAYTHTQSGWMPE